MMIILVGQLMKTMLMDYQSLTVVILINIFGLLSNGRGERFHNSFNCPCTTGRAHSPSSFDGNNYYCESATWYMSNPATYYFNDTLWDGAGCIDNCCNGTTQPWFYHQLNQITQDDIEARICSLGPFSDRATLIDQLELFIQ